MENTDTYSIWSNILEDLKHRISEQQFKTWFKNISLDLLSQKFIRVSVQTIDQASHIEQYYADSFLNSVEKIYGRRPLLEITVHDAPSAYIGTVPSSDFTIPDRQTNGASSFMGSPDIILNKRYTFDNFVVGPSNRLAHAASLAVAESSTQIYNPLFIHGSVGLGKTHLLQAICHRMLKERNGVKILYLSCESFISHYISAVKRGDLDQFRYKYRGVDVLLVDDIHNLADKEGTQEEFFHTFNTLYNMQKQIVLSSDSPPKEIPRIEERLVSRFKWGLEARLDAPD